MGDRYGHTWIAMYGDDPTASAGQAWAHELAGLSLEQLRNGLIGCKRLAGDFPPSVFKFYALCMDFPPLAQVLHEIRIRRHSAFTTLVWSFIDQYRLGRADQREADRLIGNAYELAYARAIEYGGLPQLELRAGTMAIAHEAPGHVRQSIKPSDPVVVARNMAEIERSLHGFSPEEQAVFDAIAADSSP